MIILTTEIEQSFSIIPIYNVDANIQNIYIQLINETTKEIKSYFVSESILQNDILQLTLNTITNYLKENNFYIINIIDSAENDVIVYKDRVFVTNQSKNTYSINNGSYITPTIDNNDYITI